MLTSAGYLRVIVVNVPSVFLVSDYWSCSPVLVAGYLQMVTVFVPGVFMVSEC